VTHVYFARAARGDRAGADATAALAALRAGGAVRGDAFLGGGTVGPASAAEIARALGPAIADATGTAPIGEWIGPLESPWGVHLVRVEERTPSALPPPELVRGQVVHHLLADRSAARAATRLATLRAHWDIVREPPPAAAPPARR
jgi:parvulin-like peptidyl-prolyl isomerase